MICSVSTLTRLVIGLTLVALAVLGFSKPTSGPTAVSYAYDPGSHADSKPEPDLRGAPTQQPNWGRALHKSTGSRTCDDTVNLARTSARPVGAGLAPDTPRGLSNLGGVIEETGTNAPGGRLFTATGPINQNDFAGMVNSGLMRGDDVHILTGAHGFPDGSIVADVGLLANDVARFGSMPGVRIHDLPSMSPAQMREGLSSPGSIIGGFCDSGACLAPYRGM